MMAFFCAVLLLTLVMLHKNNTMLEIAVQTTDKVADLVKRDISAGREWEWRYDTLHQEVHDRWDSYVMNPLARRSMFDNLKCLEVR